MNRTLIGEAVLIALGMVSWPILGKYSRASGPWVGVAVMCGTGLVVGLLALVQGQIGSRSSPSLRGFCILAGAALLNGGAMYFYSMRTSTETQTAKYVVLVAVLVVLEAPIIDFWINRSALSLRQWLGVACGIACVYFLGQRSNG